MKSLKMEVARTAFVCGLLISAIHGLNFPPVTYRFPIPSRAVKAPLGDNGILLASDPAGAAYPTQRWIISPNIGLSQPPATDDSPIPPEPASGTEPPGQAGPVATPLPDGILDENVVDFPPNFRLLPDDLSDRNAFIPLPRLPGKSQRPDGLQRQPMTVYNVLLWQPVSFPEDSQPDQSLEGTKGPSSQPSTPAPTYPSADATVPTEQIWLGPSGVIYPLASVTSKTAKPAKVIPIQPVFPPPSKGYAVPDIPAPAKITGIDLRKQPIPTNSLNVLPRPGLILPGYGSVRTSDPYINGYIAALSSYNPTTPDRIKDNPSTGTVTLSNAYGDMWVLKKDSERPYFERLRVLQPPSGPAFGSQNTVRPPSSPKSNTYIIKGPKAGSFYPQKGIFPLPPQPGINVLSPVPASAIRQPCPTKTTPLPTNRPYPRPAKVQITGKGNPFPGPFNRIAPYSYVTWNPSGGSYLVPLSAPNSAIKSGEVVPPPSTLRSVPRVQLPGGYWRPIPEQSRPGLVMPPVPVAAILSSTPSQMTPEPTVDSSSSPSSTEPSSTAPSSSETLASEASSLELESQLKPLAALKQEETPISRSTEVGPQDPEIPLPADASTPQKPLRYRSYVFRYDYNSPDGTSERVTRLIPLGQRESSMEQNGLANRNPLKFHRAVSYLFREDGIPSSNELTTENTLQPSSSEVALPAASLDLTSISGESSNIVPVAENIDRDR